MKKKRLLALLLCLSLLLTLPIAGTVATDVAETEVPAVEEKKEAETITENAPVEVKPEPAAETAPEIKVEENQQESAKAESSAETENLTSVAENVTEVPVTDATDIPAVETTEVPATDATEVPAVDTTEVPTTDATDIPAVETTEVPATDATEVPTVDSTETPTVTPTAEPSEVPPTEPPIVAQVTLTNLSASVETIYPGQSVSFTFESTGAVDIHYVLKFADGSIVAEGSASAESPLTFAPTNVGRYILTITATGADGTIATAECTTEVVAPDLSVALTSAQRYAVANESAIEWVASVSGGVAPYTIEQIVTVNDAELCHTANTADVPGDYSLSCMPTAYGTHTITVIITDAAGQTKRASFEMPVSDHSVVERSADWEKAVKRVKLTGNWREDVIAIAKTQLGYEESKINFIIDEEGKQKGYTRYGAWYGAPYSDWCAMFVSFCLNYADVERGQVGWDAGCNDWKGNLRGMGAYEDDADYIPHRGDLIFFNWEGKKQPEHIGVVTRVTDSTVYTIEGNSASCVRECSYSRTDKCIIGYGNMETLMLRAGVLDVVEKTDSIVNMTAVVNANDVNLRAEPSMSAQSLMKLNEGSPVTPVAVLTMKSGKAWVQVRVEEVEGYIFAEYVDLIGIPAEETLPEVNDTPQVGETLPTPADEPLVKMEISADSVSISCDLTAETDVWQVQNGDAWVDIASGASITLPSTVENIMASYRCVRRDDAGETVLCATIPMDAEIVDWVSESGADVNMLVRALSANSLDSLVLEDGKLIYVRTGKAVASVDEETDEVLDLQYQIIVAHYDAETNTLRALNDAASEP